MRVLLFCLSIILITNSIFGQSRLELYDNSMFHHEQLDTTKLLSDTPLKSPWGAVLRSAVVPGWGQLYTEQYIKAGIAFTVNSFFLYQIYKYEMKWRDEKNEDFRIRRNTNTWYFALAYLLTMIDAYVEAYLYKFNKAMEISQNIKLRGNHWHTELKITFYF